MRIKPIFHIIAPPAEAKHLREAAAATLSYVTPLLCGHRKWACSLKFSTNAEVQQLNHQFRGKDKPTNVLSFPAGEGFAPPGAPFYLGDIIFAEETIREEAKAQTKNFADHLKHLTIHGLLHLYGYDHLTDQDASVMETLEISILKTLNIKNPYENN